MFLGQTKACQTMHGKRLGHETGASGTIEVPTGQTRDRPPLQKDLKGFTMFSGRLESIEEDDLPGRDRVKQGQQAGRRGVRRQSEISRRDIQPRSVPTLLVPRDGRQVVSPT